MLAGVPQFMAIRALTYSGGVGSSNEVNLAALNGQAALAGTQWTETAATHSVTGGPTNAGPVIVEANGVFWAIPFNQTCSAPDYVWNALIKTTDAAAGGQWTWS
jgi:hypothetical protein